MKNIKSMLTAIFMIVAINLNAQLNIDAELRPRFEYRHGYKTLFPDNSEPAAFVAQRTRINTSYKMNKLNFYISIQDVRVWGDVKQLNSADNNGLTLQQAWAKISLTNSSSIKNWPPRNYI